MLSRSSRPAAPVATCTATRTMSSFR